MSLLQDIKSVRLKKRFLLPMLLFPLGLSLLGVIIIFVYSAFTFNPKEVKISNVTPYSATISWVTKAKTKGIAIALEEPTKLPILLDVTKGNKSFDDRDWNKAEIVATEKKNGAVPVTEEEITNSIFILNLGNYTVHHVTLRNLVPETEYHLMIGNGGIYKKVKLETEASTITTLPESEDLYTPEPAYGQVKMWGTDDPITDGVVYLEIDDRNSTDKSSLISATLSENGSWYLDLTTAKSSTGKPFITASKSDNIEHYLTVETGEYGKFARYVPLTDDAPVDTVYLGEPEPEAKKNPDYELEYLGNSTTGEGTTLSGLMSLVYATDCGETGGAKPCSSCTGPKCDEGTTYGANGEVWGPGYMEYCAKRKCEPDTQDQQTPDGGDCECACEGGTWDCTGGLTCKNHECVSPEPDPPDEPPVTAPPGTPAECIGYDGGLETWGLDGTGAQRCPTADTCPCHCNNDPSETCAAGAYCQCAAEPSNDCCCDDLSGNPFWFDAETCNLDGFQCTDSGYCVDDTPDTPSAPTVPTVVGDPAVYECSDPGRPCWAGSSAGMCSGDRICETENMGTTVCCTDVSPHRTMTEGECMEAAGGTYHYYDGECVSETVCCHEVEPHREMTMQACLDEGGGTATYNAGSCGSGEPTLSPTRQVCCHKNDGTTETQTYNACKAYWIGTGSTTMTFSEGSCPVVADPPPDPAEAIPVDGCPYDDNPDRFCSRNNCAAGTICTADMCNEHSEGRGTVDSPTWYYYTCDIPRKPGDETWYGDSAEGECNNNCHDTEYYTASCSDTSRLISANAPEGPGEYMASCTDTSYYRNLRRCTKNADGTWKIEHVSYTCSYTVKTMGEGDTNTNLDLISTLLEPSKAYAQEEYSSFTYIPETGSYIVNEAGLYTFLYNGITYEVEIEDSDNDIIIFIDQNGNHLYDSSIDVHVASNPVELSFEQISSEYTYSLRRGFNFVSFNFLPTEFELTAADMLTYLDNKSPNTFYSLSRYTSSGWEITGIRDGAIYQTGDFQITPGIGYVLRVSSDIDISLFGNEVVNAVPISLRPGWNLTAVHGSLTNYTAESLITSISDTEEIQADNVSRWDSSRGRYDGLQITPDNNGVLQVYGYDFPLVEQQAYFVRILQGEGRWTPE